ncbi:MAG TPA: type II CAAX endopeptidase family protein [Acidobacteriaceae bacterium]|nr:type II CAAX endopeptidase family protein [Acidobacteriaceae bacterium]
MNEGRDGLTESQRDAGPEPGSPFRGPIPQPEFLGHRLFYGPQGLRAGWSLLLFATLVFLLMQGFGLLVGPYVRIGADGTLPPLASLLMELAQFAPVLLATAILAVFEGRPLTFYGFQGRARGRRFLAGLGCGFAAISVLVLLLRQLGYLVLDGRAIAAGPALRYAVVWGGIFLLVGLTEEMMFRGYAQFTMTRGVGFWWGAVLIASAFGLMHSLNGGESPLGLVAVGAVGLVFCLSLWYTGSLWWAVGFHAAWDWGESYFYGTADSGLVAQGHLLREHPVGAALWSGGTTGPEGSVLIFALLAVIAVLMVLWWGRRGEKPFAGRAWRPSSGDKAGPV